MWRFHPDFRTDIFVFYKQKQLFLYWPYCDSSNSSFALVEPRTSGMGFKRVQNSIITRRIIQSLAYTNMSSRLCPGGFAFAVRVIFVKSRSLSHSVKCTSTGTIVFSEKCTIGMAKGLLSVIIFARLLSISFELRKENSVPTICCPRWVLAQRPKTEEALRSN